MTDYKKVFFVYGLCSKKGCTTERISLRFFNGICTTEPSDMVRSFSA